MLEEGGRLKKLLSERESLFKEKRGEGLKGDFQSILCTLETMHIVYACIHVNCHYEHKA